MFVVFVNDCVPVCCKCVTDLCVKYCVMLAELCFAVLCLCVLVCVCVRVFVMFVCCL